MTASNPDFHLHLLGGFELWLEGRVVPVTIGAQRLLAFLGLHDRVLTRAYVAGVLWPEVPTDRANANLRAGLWRLPTPCRLVVDQSAQCLRLAADVSIDFHAAAAAAQRLLDSSQPCPEGDLSGVARMQLTDELLPDWYDDDWVLPVRERFHQLRLHALEALCDRLTAAGRFGEAIDAGLAAVSAEPLRESAHRTLIRAHIAEGNQVEAGRQYELCRHLLHEELGVQPSAKLRELVLEERVLASAVVSR
jgi:DNA-binding SARP family transcriptional activator